MGLNKNTEYKLYMVAKDKAYDINTKCKVSEDTYYTGNEVKPEIVVKYGNHILTEGKDYNISYVNNVNVSENGYNASVVITGIGDYSGEKSIEYAIVYLDVKGKYQINSQKDDNGLYESMDITPAEGYELYDVHESAPENGVKTFAFRIRRSIIADTK